ncbi:MAG TPA: hypothetical protein VN030_06380 [Cellvibrio sp.]|nr:hypothetical protein [Cellvibrio sp.]
MLAWVLKLFNITEGLNFFPPRAFENGIANFLTLRHGQRFSPVTNQQALLAPMNWQPLTGFPCIAARFDAVANNYNVNRSSFSYLTLPLSKHPLFIIYCGVSRYTSPPEMQPRPSIDEWIDPKPFIELANQVLDSLEVTLSSEAQAQQEEALRGLQDKSLVSEFPPLQWTKSDIVQA